MSAAVPGEKRPKSTELGVSLETDCESVLPGVPATLATVELVASPGAPDMSAVLFTIHSMGSITKIDGYIPNGYTLIITMSLRVIRRPLSKTHLDKM
ncbi:MAG: hypothetical protein COV52_01195 [Gammaproteobacteria bacterium CG11_big_fil_rev_8_21_14_0_20_46_22]|nr:MAG: hypothetical protein COW05_03490 [Gammaproteobacteria bacterium CG12_big_fil_rev_8_21_14_0_65_46_12]PIR11971.1 MAG: hypothetical protein COV52_01195 [Gammaproteobacteria bacterium CG11_big_fil_rev_8_21_14_0_20_46_22]